MSDLNDIVGVILRDLNRAQDASNRHSALLAGEYGESASLAAMPIPHACLTEVEIDLRYAIDKLEETATLPEQRLAAVRDCAGVEAGAIARAATEQVRRVLARVVALADAAEGATDGRSAEGRARLEKMQANVVSESFQGHVAARVREVLAQRASSLLSDSGMLSADRLFDATMGALDEALLRHPALAGLFGPDKPARADLETALTRDLQPLTKRAAAGANQAMTQRRGQSIDVIVGAAALSSLPSEAVHTMRLRIDLRKVPWDNVADGGQLVTGG